MIQLSPPRLVTFLLSLILAGLPAASMYIRVPVVGHYVVGHRMRFLIAAYVVLTAGIVSRKL
jgi:hypothetical protein